MAREELAWQNLDVDTLPGGSKKALDSLLAAENAFKATLEKDLKSAGLMPSDKHLVISRKGGTRIGVAFSDVGSGVGGSNMLAFKKAK